METRKASRNPEAALDDQGVLERHECVGSLLLVDSSVCAENNLNCGDRTVKDSERRDLALCWARIILHLVDRIISQRDADRKIRTSIKRCTSLELQKPS